MDPAIVARALHVLGVVLWIGGVAFVTTVLLPSVRRLKSPEERVAFFEVHRGPLCVAGPRHDAAGRRDRLPPDRGLGSLDRFTSAAYWWMHAMVALWAIFTVMLFVAEPLFLHRGSSSGRGAIRRARSAASSACTGCC